MIAGSFGFAVDVGVLMALVHLVHVDAVSARVMAIGCAISGTWFINRNFTFDKSAHSLAKEGVRYWGIAAFSAGINFAVYTLLLLVDRQMIPILALAASSACGTLFPTTAMRASSSGGKVRREVLPAFQITCPSCSVRRGAG